MEQNDLISACLPVLGSRLRREPLALLPTPVRTVEVVHAAVKRLISIKCDDRSGPLYGGNKVRKLEFAFGAARARNKKRIATFGAVGSNHALATSLYAHALGYSCTCFLSHQAETAGIAKTLNMHLANQTTIVRFGGNYANRLSILRQHFRNGGFWVIPIGGSSWLGTLGYVNAALELAEQIDNGELAVPDRIYIATGTMGSAVGLAIGLELAGLRCQVDAVRVTANRFCSESLIRRLTRKTVTMMNYLDASVSLKLANKVNIRLRNSFFGDGYACSNRATDDALLFAKEHLGITLETTYTAKAMAALLRDFGQSRNERVLFWNTYNSVPLTTSGDLSRVDLLPKEFRKYVIRA